MTEDVTIEDGRLRVARPAKEDVDIDLSNVETVHYERGLFGENGAMVVRETDNPVETVIRVDEVDAPEVYSKIMEAVPAKMEPSEESTVDASADLAVKTSEVAKDARTGERKSEGKSGKRQSADRASDQA